MQLPHDNLALRRALLGNAGFSTLCGLTLSIGSYWLAPLLGVPTLALFAVGLGLLPFAYGLWRNASEDVLDRREAWIAVALDLGWVLGSAALVLGDLWPLTAAGVWTVVCVADVVLVLALLQIRGLKMGRADRPRRSVGHPRATSDPSTRGR